MGCVFEDICVFFVLFLGGCFDNGVECRDDEGEGGVGVENCKCK